MKLRKGRGRFRALIVFLRNRDPDKLFIINLLSISINRSNKYIPSLKFSWIFMNLTMFEITFFCFKKVSKTDKSI